ncbi:MAG: hypothetical protein AAF282_18785 [Cyanobacteria bacterium P01_A01_bin.15]
MKRFIAPIFALVVVVTGLTLMGTGYSSLAQPSETDQAYFIKHVPDANVVVVEPNYGEFFHPDPAVQGDASGEILYSSLDSLAHSYDIRRTEMVSFERKGKVIPNLYVFVDAPSEEFQMANGGLDEQSVIAENVGL